jgi:hypothetical protein
LRWRAAEFLDDALAGRLSHSDQEIRNDADVAAVNRDLPAAASP